MTSVAYSVGFNDGSHFARMFKRYTQALPSEYRAGERPVPQQSHVPGGLHQPVPRRRASDHRAVDRRRKT